MLAVWSERLAKGLYQQNNLVARLEPAILKMQIQAFYQLSYPQQDQPFGAAISCNLKEHFGCLGKIPG